MTELSRRIKSIRESNEITQAELAARVGMLPAQLCRIETGYTDPSVGTATRIAEALGMSLGDLLLEHSEVIPAAQSMSVPSDADKKSDVRSDPVLVRDVPHPTESAVRKAIAERESRYDTIDARRIGGSSTLLQLVHPFLRDAGGAETLARVLRASLGAGETTFADLAGLLDLNGVRVHIVSFRGTEPSVSFYDLPRGILSIAVRKGDTPERQTYRLAYELGAACLFAGDGFQTILDKDSNHRLIQRFAAAFLMPEDGVRKVVAQCGLGRKDWTMHALLTLKVRFNVSAEAFALRLEELGLIKPSVRNRFRDELRAYYAAHPKNMEPAPNLSPLRESVRMEVANMRNAI